MKLKTFHIFLFFMFVVALSLLAKPIKKIMTRGYINKNPGNIRKTPDMWKGEVKGKDKDFKTFSSMEYGYRAIFVLLRTYLRNGLNTITKIVSTYAPSNENDTQSYIRSVEYHSKINRNEILTYDKVDEIFKIVAAISYHENGVQPNMKEIEGGYKLFKQS